MSDTFRERFLDHVCLWDWAFGLLFAMNVVLLVILGMSYLIAPGEGSATVITTLSLIVILASLVVLGSLVRICRTRDEYESRATDE